MYNGKTTDSYFCSCNSTMWVNRPGIGYSPLTAGCDAPPSASNGSWVALGLSPAAAEKSVKEHCEAFRNIPITLFYFHGWNWP